jgi:proteasome lid subunit RPN8/RPN11
MTLRIDQAALKQLHAHAEEGYPHEVIGLLVGDREAWQVSEVVPLVNERADSAHNRYKVSGLVLMRAEQAVEARGLQVVGYYHSHPDHPAQYSEFDREHALPNMSYPIVAVHDGAVVNTLAWRLTDDRSAMTPEAIEVFDG